MSATTTSVPTDSITVELDPDVPAAIPREVSGYFSLCEALIRQAQADLRHTCWTSGCRETMTQCHEHQTTARRFLRALRTGQAPLWSAWVTLASRRVEHLPQYRQSIHRT